MDRQIAAAAAMPEGFDAAVRAHLPGLLVYARRLTVNATDAEDLVQDLLLTLWERPEACAGVTALRPWLMRAVYHRFVDGYRRRQASPVRYAHELVLQDRSSDAATLDGPAEDMPSAEPGPDTLTEWDELRSFVRHALERLSPTQRLLVDLHHLQGLGLSEISARQNVSINTLKSSLLRAHVQLRSQLSILAPAPCGLDRAFAARCAGFGGARRRRRATRSATAVHATAPSPD